MDIDAKLIKIASAIQHTTLRGWDVLMQATCDRAVRKVAEVASEYVCTVDHTPSCVDSEFPAECTEDIFTTPCLKVHFAC